MNNVLSDFHIHTLYCDGNNTVREMIEAAIGKGLHSLGFSGHGNISFDDTFGTPLEKMPLYIQEVRALQQEYRDRIHIFLGIENDSMDIQPTAGYDYSIGSVHYVYYGGCYHSPDDTVEKFARSLHEYFADDPYLFARGFFAEVARNITISRPDIVGHLDSFSKLNRGGRFFDESNTIYRRAALEALEVVAEKGAIIEINTGAVARGYRDTPYPARYLLERMKELRTPIILNSDAHSTEGIAYGFAETAALLYDIGFRERMELTQGGFVPVKL